ncbi:MAG: Uma2 family endonuclease [Solirubrobacteraceae bacterium]|jgi:Uma2 family endonuclease
MPTLVFDPQPAELEALLERRREWGADRWDEVWDGVLHMIPPPSHEHQRLASRLHEVLGPLARAAGLELTGEIGLGSGRSDYRVPDLALHRPGAAAQWHPTVAVAVEIVSPGDKTWDKLSFYAAHHVDELVIIDPQQRSVDWLALDHGEYRPVDRGRVIDSGPSQLAYRLDWR